MNITVSEILSNMGHDIRTPMNAITGFSGLLEQYISDELQNEYHKSLKSSSKRLFSIINNIIDLSKIENKKLKLQNREVNLKSFLTDLVNQNIEVDNKIFFEINKFFPDIIFIDEVRLKQIIINLIALIFNQSKYELNIQVEPVINSKFNIVNGNDKRQIIDFCLIFVCRSHFNVIDRIERYLSNINENLQTVKFDDDTLVFSLTHRLIDLMNGKLSVIKEAHQKSLEIEFTSIKCVEKDFSKIAKTINNLDYSKIVFNNCKIVLADDVRLNRAVIKELFRHTDVKIIEAVNGKEAIFHALKHLPDIILLDIKMPILDGYGALEVIKKEDSLMNIPVIAVSASLTKVEKKEILERGFNGFLLKPVHPIALYRELAKYLKFSVNSPDKEILSDSPDLVPFVKKDVDSWGKIVMKLENEIYEQWQIANENNLISDILIVSEAILGLAKKYNIERTDILIDYSNKIDRYAKNFDIENLKLTLDGYLDFINYIKSLIPS